MLQLIFAFALFVGRPAAAEPAALAIRIQGGCAAGPFMIPSWCPDPGPGVIGGLERVVEVREGVEVDLFLENRFPWRTRGDLFPTSTGAWFVLVTEAQFEKCHKAFASPEDRARCRENPAFGLSFLVPEGTDYRARFVPVKAGTYRYYDELHVSGYGVLKVLP